MIPEQSDLKFWTDVAFTGQELEPVRDAFKACLHSLIDTVRELERLREELERMARGRELLAYSQREALEREAPR